MTEQVCPTYASSSKENCNQCLLSECGDCLNACYDSQNCPDNFSFYKEVKLGDNTITYQVTSSDDGPSDSRYPEGISSGGEKYVCGVNPQGDSKEVRIGTGSFQNIASSNESNFNLTASGFHAVDDNTSAFYVAGTHTQTPGEPTFPAGEDIFVKGIFSGKKASKTFEYIQDIYSENFKKYKEFISQNPELPSLEIDLYSLRNIDQDSLALNLFNSVKELYNLSTFETKNMYMDKQHMDKEHALLLEKIESKRALIHELKEMNSTNKRNIEININKTRKMKETNDVLMVVMVLVGILILFPLLSLAKIVSRSTGIIIWCLALLLILFYMAYQLYYKQINRDEADYKKFIFNKPTDKEIAQSRALAQLSDKDKARCQAFAELEEELDAPKINLDVSEYYSRTDQVDQCEHLN